MKSKIRVELDMNLKPVLQIKLHGHPYYSDQDLADKVLAKLFDGAVYFEIIHTGAGSCSKDGNYSEIELRPVTYKDLHQQDPQEAATDYVNLARAKEENTKGIFLKHPMKHNTVMSSYSSNWEPQIPAEYQERENCIG